jgi:hypothetical protein
MRFGIRSTGLALALLTSLASEASGQVVGTFASVDGTVELRRGDAGPQRPAVGTPVLAKDVLQVADTGRVRLLLRDDTLVDLGATSHVVVQAGDTATARGERTSVKLDSGTLRARVSLPAPKTPGFEVETPAALVRTSDGDIVVLAEERASEVLCLEGHAQVQGTLGVIGKRVELTAGRATRVQSGALPSAARSIDDETKATALRAVSIIGTGGDDHLDSGNPLLAGHLLAPGDRPNLPPAAQASVEKVYLHIQPPGETLLEQLSPDLRTNTQPIPEYKLAAPGEQPPPPDQN